MSARPIWPAFALGWRQRCPACGQGRLYSKYLKVVDQCDQCGQALHHHRADDAPPYFTMLIVGHVIVGLVLKVEMTYHPELLVHLLLWGPSTLLLSLFLLPRIKGALIGIQWAARMHGFGAGRDPALPDALPDAPPVRHG